ncbi:MAG: bifunctional phosphoserine phosphatase/homoserine phosphotransferase ThrH [Candidatus Competibacteraceae bacterium]|nr:bifunctional phosphoserine phosphatase/homoserine phosphotransferase ThrH [Candidatus Competibacteraceae bacterium]
MELACLDLEGVLVPEIWINVAERTGIEALRLTTRDIPDYDQLMRRRLALLDQHGLKLSDIQRVIASMGPLDGAHQFLDWLRERFQVVILSDTYYEFAMPLMRQLGWPALFCHRLEVVADRVVNYTLRQSDSKRQAVRAFHGLNFRVIAAGDSYNDTAMLAEAEAGILFRPPQNVRPGLLQRWARRSAKPASAHFRTRLFPRPITHAADVRWRLSFSDAHIADKPPARASEFSWQLLRALIWVEMEKPCLNNNLDSR